MKKVGKQLGKNKVGLWLYRLVNVIDYDNLFLSYSPNSDLRTFNEIKSSIFEGRRFILLEMIHNNLKLNNQIKPLPLWKSN